MALGNLAKLLLWSILSLLIKIEKQTLSLSQFSLATGFFEGTRKNILHIFWTLILFKPGGGMGKIMSTTFTSTCTFGFSDLPTALHMHDSFAQTNYQPVTSCMPYQFATENSIIACTMGRNRYVLLYALRAALK